MANCSNAAAVTFPQNTGASQTVTHFSIGYAITGATTMYASSVFTDLGFGTSRVIATGATPSFAIGELDVNLTTTSSEFEADFLVNALKLYFQNVDHAEIGDAAGLQNSAAAGNVYVALHTDDPAGNTQDEHEATYTGYGNRIAVARSAVGWTVV